MPTPIEGPSHGDAERLSTSTKH